MAISNDGLHWLYKRIVLAEPFHLSYPYVFEWEGEYYMIPESERSSSIRLYRAAQFPAQWEFCNTLLKGEYVDTSVLNYAGKWWMFTSPSRHNDVLELYYADNIVGPWSRHPRSPLVKDNNAMARPGGRVLFHDGKIIRYAQDCRLGYGNGVRAFEITKLTRFDYEEHEVAENPIIKGSGKGWNKIGMHTIDAHKTGEHAWIAAVDGYEKDLLFIGY